MWGFKVSGRALQLGKRCAAPKRLPEAEVAKCINQNCPDRMNKHSSIGAAVAEYRPRSCYLVKGNMCLRAARTLTALLLLLMLTLTAEAKDMSHLYSTQELETWHYILEPQTQRNFEILLSQGLDEKEKQLASGVRLEMPLRGRHNDLIEFYAYGKTVAVPVLSLKFLHDILLANAWLYLHKFDPRTVDEYLSMLKYNEAADFPNGRYPRPLDALGIPEEARIVPPSDPVFENAFIGTMLVTSGFIMAHELGHVVLGHTAHRATTLKGRLREEQDADAFALRALSRIRPDVDGMMMFFTLTSAWAFVITDFPSREAYEQYLARDADHPLTGERIRALGREVYNNPRQFLFREELWGEMRDVERPTPENIARRQRFGTRIIKLGDLVDDEAYQRALAIRGIGTSLDRLKPRPLDAPLPPTPRPGASR